MLGVARRQGAAQQGRAADLGDGRQHREAGGALAASADLGETEVAELLGELEELRHSASVEHDQERALGLGQRRGDRGEH